jgi:hypothetical protein
MDGLTLTFKSAGVRLESTSDSGSGSTEYPSDEGEMADDSDDGEMADGSDDGEPAEMGVLDDDRYDHMDDGFEDASALNDESHTPLFCGSSLSRLDATLMFMNVCRTHKATNALISEMLHLMSKVILPLRGI